MPEADPRTYLAEERTLLAWIRTALAVTAFGFVVARFGLFLSALAPSLGTQLEPSGFSPTVGISLIAMGVLVNLLACFGHVKRVQSLKRAGLILETPSTPGIAVALLLAMVGIALAVYLATQTVIHPQGAGKEQTSMLTGSGIISRPSSHPVPETLDRLEAVLRNKAISVFARVDHSGEAAKVGLTLPPTQVLIFGNPKAGTPVMLAAPTAAIDLPLKALAWQDADGKVWLSYTDPAFLARRFGLTDAQVAPIAGVGALIDQALQ
jgi:uncharacterized protein (DUF302 family)/uncharacterized membrane protein YidH (DUF202 family)